MDIVFRKPPSDGRGNPGVPRLGVTQSPTLRQPNRGRKPGDPFVCVGCRGSFPADEEYFLGVKPQGRCRPCGKAKRSADHARRMLLVRGPDYVLPVSKDEQYPVVNGYRECSECGDVLAVEMFYKDRTVTSGLQNVCKPCRKTQRNGRWHGLSPKQKSAVQEHQWRQWIWRRFWLSPERYDEMLAEQNGACAICAVIPDSRLCVDHDHSCCPGEYTCGGCVRQLLCTPCNIGVGYIERVGSVSPFADYLARHAAG